MGKKAKNASGIAKAAQRKVNKAQLPPPPVPVEEEVRSHRLLGIRWYDFFEVGENFLRYLLQTPDQIAHKIFYSDRLDLPKFWISPLSRETDSRLLVPRVMMMVELLICLC